MSDSIASALTLFRTAADSLASLSESAARGAINFARTAADSLASLLDSIVSVYIPAVGGALYERTVGDSISAISDGLAQLGTYARTVADSIGSLSEAILSSRFLPRTVADSLSAISETAARVGTFIRTVATNIQDEIWESFERVGSSTWHRTAGDSVASISDAVTRGRLWAYRTTSDSVASLSEDENCHSILFLDGAYRDGCPGAWPKAGEHHNPH